jgi:toxin ParE1/3/4
MNGYAVVFTPEAEEQLAEIYRYIADHGSPDTALRYTTAIVDYCSAMKDFPYRGTQRDDIRPGLRTVSFRKSTIIAFAVDTPTMTVTIAGVFYGGRDYAEMLANS